MLIINVSSGPDKGRSFELDEQRPLILGRQGDQHKLADRQASRRHARVWLEDGRWMLRDLESRHGTYLNGKSIGHDIVPVCPGDCIRIGVSQMEVTDSDMAGDMAERADLLGEPLSEKEALRATGFGDSRSRLAPLALAAAFTIVTSLVVYSMIQARVMNRSLQDQLAAINQNDDPLLRDILARLDDQQQRDAVLNEIRTALAAQPDPTVKLDTLLAKVDLQSQHWQTLASMRDDLIQQQQTASRQADQKLDHVLARLDQPIKPAADPQTAEKLDTILARLDQQPTAPQIDADQLAEQISGQLATRVSEQLQASSDANASLLQQIVANLDDQRQLSGQITELRDLVAAQPDQTRRLLHDAVADLATRQDATAVASAVEQIRSALPPDASDKLDQVLSKLDAQTSPQQMAAALQTVIEKQAGVQSESLDQLRQQLQQLADAQRTTPDAILNEIRAAASAREQADARLAELIELAGAQPTQSDQTNDLLQQVLAELRNRSEGPSDEVLRQVLRELRSKAIASMDELRAAIRSELDTRLQGAAPAKPAAPAAVARNSSEPAESPAIIDGQASASTRVSMSSALLPADSLAGDDTAALSTTELAYKTAFDTGQPVTLGSGRHNPLTGEVSDGRTLDPAAAKAAGIKTWREWYLMDDFAERMRLQQQAARNSEQSDSDPDLIKLPAGKSH
ncbi:MAG: FHA domain-containing protein [Phycisphaeraceae bacterium]|nr:FHA domain-containing protein [Phycisphaeraceae bacterium]